MSRLLLVGAFVLPLLVCGDPEPVKSVFGLVADPNGFPLPGVQIDHTGCPGPSPVSDREGMFHFATRAPLVVFRKEGYQSRVVRLDRLPLRIMLRPSFRVLPICAAGIECSDIGGAFCFPNLPGIDAARISSDSALSERAFGVDGAGQKLFHGGGPLWGLSRPFDDDVWQSVRYSEVTFRVHNRSVLAVRGVSNSGKRWRFFGMAGESAYYRDVDSNMAELLDRMIDGVCLRQAQR